MPRTPAYRPLYDDLRSRLAAGEFPQGTRLPSVSQLATTWNTTPGTANQAIRRLASEGLVTAQRGNGTFATGRRPDEDADLRQLVTDLGAQLDQARRLGPAVAGGDYTSQHLALIYAMLVQTGTTQAELAARLQITPKHLSQMLNRRVRLNPDILERIAVSLGCRWHITVVQTTPPATR